MNKSFNRYFPEIVTVLFVILFVYTAVSKLLDYRGFSSSMDIMPAVEGNGFLLAPGIIIAEIIISGLLILPATRLPGLWLSLLLMSVFTFYLLFAVAKGYTLPCSCGGVLRQLSWKQHAIFNIAFVLLAAAAILLHLKQRNLLQ
jgi:hypothetical protein